MDDIFLDESCCDCLIRRFKICVQKIQIKFLYILFKQKKTFGWRLNNQFVQIENILKHYSPFNQLSVNSLHFVFRGSVGRVCDQCVRHFRAQQRYTAHLRDVALFFVHTFDDDRWIEMENVFWFCAVIVCSNVLLNETIYRLWTSAAALIRVQNFCYLVSLQKTWLLVKITLRITENVNVVFAEISVHQKQWFFKGGSTQNWWVPMGFGMFFIASKN